MVVWGNCQAPALARLLRAPLAAADLEVVDVPPVFEVDQPGLERVRRLVRRAAALVTHPVRDEYATPGCGSAALTDLLPRGSRVVRVASAYHVGPFPWLVDGHGGDGGRVDAPLTAYHDLRTVARAVGEAVPEAVGYAAVDAASTAELRRRDRRVHVPAADLVGAPDAMHTFNHPANPVLRAIAARVLTRLGVEEDVPEPERELLGATRPPIEPAVADLLGWSPRRRWTVEGREIDQAEVDDAHLGLYRRRPDVAAETWRRGAGRLRLLAVR